MSPASLLLSASLALLLSATAVQSAFTGEGTAYSAPYDKDATGFNACQYGKLEDRWERMYGAMNSAQFKGSCGKCVRVRGIESGASGKSFLVKIVDECPTCSYGDVDFSTEALQAITGFSWDRKQISWEYADCDGPSDAKSTAEAVEEPEVADEEETKKPKTEDEETPSGKQPLGTYTSYVVECEGGRTKCPNKALASQGYQCMNQDKNKCCLTGNGKDCVDKDQDEDEEVEWEDRRRSSRKLRLL